MSGVGYELFTTDFLRGALAIVLMSGVVKLMDDFLDLRYDVFVGAQSLAMRLGEGTLPYALIGFALAVLMDPALAVAIMVGAYAVGMAGDYDRQLPSGLLGYQESIAVVAITVWFVPWPTVVWAICTTLAIQIADDICDYHTDRSSGNPNLVRRFGGAESRMLGSAALVVAALIHPVMTACAFVAVPVTLWASEAAGRPTGGNRGWAR